MQILQKACCIFDLDGTLYRGKTVIDGATQTLSLLRKQGVAVRFLSNNSNQTTSELAHKLAEMGIEAYEQEIYTPLLVSGLYLSQNFGRSSVYVVGSDALAAQIVKAGHSIADHNPTAVFIGRDLDFTFEKLQMAGRFLQNGAAFICANCDLVHPGQDGYNVPETGAIAASVACLTNTQPQFIGKPEPYIFSYLMNAEQFSQQDVVMIGDNLLTDIAGGNAAGIDTILLSEAHSDSSLQPTLQVPSIHNLYNLILEETQCC